MHGGEAVGHGFGGDATSAAEKAAVESKSILAGDAEPGRWSASIGENAEAEPGRCIVYF